MADKKKDAVPQKEEKWEQLSNELGDIETSLTHIDKIRKKQFAATLGGIVLVLLIMAFFITSLTNFVRSYDSQMLLQELSNNSSIITQSPELAEVTKSFQEIFLPAYRRELSVALESEMPKIRKKMLESTTELGTFIKGDIRQRLVERLKKAMEKIEKNIIAKHPDIAPAELQKAFDEANNHFIKAVTAIIEKRLKIAHEKLALLDKNFKMYNSTPEYAALKDMDSDAVEGKLVETFLELWIYHINPQKGELPAEGVK
ncbi:MAG: hypothetical protein L3J71_00145 [Victivallaceae bacterium]|nr:hypothetical protein [Victivallaceae bacterium]